MPITISGVFRRDRFTDEGSVIAGARAVGTGVVRAPVAAGGSGGAITHGREMTAVNTGHTAYFDSGLGRNVVDGDLTVHNSTMAASDFGANGVTITKRWFKSGLVMDRTNVTLTACRFDEGVSGYYSGTHRQFTLNWCTVDPPGAAQDDGIHYQDYTAYRCRIGGCSDGAKINGGCTLVECYILVKGQDSADHNDGLQAVGSYTGNTVQRCWIDTRPTNGIGAPNAALFAADSSNGLQIWQDNWLAGGGYVIRCHEDSTYQVTGNDLLNNSWAFGPVSRAVIPQSNITAWSNNRIVDGSGNFVSNVSIP